MRLPEARSVWAVLGLVSIANVGLAVYSARSLLSSKSKPSSSASVVNPPAARPAAPPSAPHQSLAVPSLTMFPAQNGIDLVSLDRFWENWKLIDTRYRTDNGEQRFVWANDIAYQAMKEHAAVYPDGAMFGKIAFQASIDPAFPASLEPDSFSRLQIMKRDSKAYPDTDGWGYAVIMGSKNSQAATEDSQTALACHACHRLVPDRNFVFSKSPFMIEGPGHPAVPRDGGAAGLRPRFSLKEVGDLDDVQQSILVTVAGHKKTDSIQYLAMPMFAGSANESVIVLSKFANDEHSVFYLSDPKSGQFALADGTPRPPDPKQVTCEPGTRLYFSASGSTVPREVSIALALLCGDQMAPIRIRRLSAFLSDKGSLADNPGGLPFPPGAH